MEELEPHLDLLRAALEEIAETCLARLRCDIEALKRARPPGGNHRPRSLGCISAETRRKISLAQQKRWRRQRAIAHEDT